MLVNLSEETIALLKDLKRRKEDLTAVLDDYNRLRRKVDGFQGDGVSNSPWAMTAGQTFGLRKKIPPSANSPLVRVKITGSASGGGKYTGRIFTGSSSASGTGTLAETDLGTDPATENALILNSREVGQSTHDLASASFLPLLFLGMNIGTTTTGLTIVMIDGAQWENCT